MDKWHKAHLHYSSSFNKLVLTAYQFKIKNVFVTMYNHLKLTSKEEKGD